MKEASSNIDVVGHIAGFTSLRDVDLLELSLLKSIYGIVNPIQVSLVSLDSQNIILKKVDYSASKHGTIATKLDASDEFLAACEKLDNTSLEYCSFSTEDATLSLFLLSHTRKIAHYISIESSNFGVSKSHSQQIIGMLKIYRNFKQLLQESQTDELTGLSNRKAFDLVSRNINDSTFSSSEPVSNNRRRDDIENQYWLALLDIDHFKKINDTHGHLMGDEVLVRAAQSMQTALRDSDLIFRVGGEEFAVIAPAKNQQEMEEALTRVKNSISAINIPQIGKITVSMGVVQMKKEVFHMTLVERADKCLYQSKTNGRDRITFFTESDQANDTPESGFDAELF